MEQSRLGRWIERHTAVVDAMWIVPMALLLLTMSSSLTGYSEISVPMPVFYFTLAVEVGALIWRRTHPAASAFVVFFMALFHLLAGMPIVFPVDFAVLVALYSVTAYGPKWAGNLAATASAIGAFVFMAVAIIQEYGNSENPRNSLIVFMFGTAFIWAICGTTWILAILKRVRVTQYRDAVTRNELLISERDQALKLAAQAERNRIAREMHDIVAHSLSVIIAQADGGRYAAKKDPEAATRALDTVSATGRNALADTRRILGVLRADGTDALETSPQPEAQDLDQLIEQMRETGMTIAFVTIGSPRDVPAGIGLSAFRIVQESLTNVLKHAGPDPSVTVTQRWNSGSVELDIIDDGRGAEAFASSDNAGHGLIGMRERVALFGGTLEAGALAAGGFRVHATFPTSTSLAGQ